MKNIVGKIKEFSCLFFLKGVTDEEINFAECKLNLKFSNEYKQYLREFGVASFEGHEWTGICKSDRLNVVQVTKEEISRKQIIPKGLYVIEQTHIDDIVIWQNEQGEVFQSSFNEIPRKIADSLLEYIELDI